MAVVPTHSQSGETQQKVREWHISIKWKQCPSHIVFRLKIHSTINGPKFIHLPVLGTYKFKYRQSSDWFASSGRRRRNCASRPRGISSNASGPDDGTGGA